MKKRKEKLPPPAFKIFKQGNKYYVKQRTRRLWFYVYATLGDYDQHGTFIRCTFETEASADAYCKKVAKAEEDMKRRLVKNVYL